ncbi:MAG: hypothetical protein KatS3mg032_1104 [Cyclobacteriaceae bacterium]|nr:MAG: hypothetical protein KatS3mg032_1104 [Cyclobacteriaceae bacterium]
MKRYFLAAFIIFSGAELVTTWFNLPQWQAFSKPFLVPSLIGYYVFSCSKRPLSIAFMLALFFCWVGDVLLMFESYFIFGLLAFLTGHLLFTAAWRQHRNPATPDSLTGLQRLRMAFPVVLYATGMVVVLYPHLDRLRVPVVLYAGVLAFMVLQALFRYGRTSAASFGWVFAGSVLFMVSDSLLAFNKFIGPVAHSGFWIMLTYISAQLLMVQGVISHASESQ